MRLHRWGATAVLAAFAAVVAAAWIIPGQTQRVADDVLIQHLSPAFQVGSRSLRLEALICESVIAQSQRPLLIARDRAHPGRLTVLASQQAVRRSVLHGDCATLDRCRVHVLQWSSRPSQTYQAPRPSPGKGVSFAPDWSLCQAGPGEPGQPHSRPRVERATPMHAVAPPLFWPGAFTDLNLIRSTSFAFAPLWLAGLLVVAAIRTRAWMLLALAPVPVGVAILFVLPGAILGGLVVLVDLGAALTAALLVPSWVLTRREPPPTGSAAAG